MLKRSLQRVGLLLSHFTLLVPMSAAHAMETANLLLNGDAEQHRCTDDWTAQTPIPGWRVLGGAASVLCYSAFHSAHETPSLPTDTAVNTALFGAPGADTAMEQTVKLHAAHKAIDSGNTRFKLSAWLGGWRDRPEHAILTAVFLDEDGHATGQPVILSHADAQARSKLTGLLAKEIAGAVPKHTRQITVTVQFLSDLTSYHNAYADNISLKLSGDVANLKSNALEPPVANIPALDHVYVVMMENTNYADVVHTATGKVSINPQMPFLASVAKKGVILSNMWANYHPSDQNYVAMAAGDTYKYGSVYFPDYNLPVTHLGDQLDAHGKSWKAYVQNMQTPCNLLSDTSGKTSYAPDDQPFVHFQNVISNPARCTASSRDLSDFEAAISTNTLPNFAWIAADGWWDGEGAWWDNKDINASVIKQDEFLANTFKPLLESSAWLNSRSLLIITWDESLGWGWPDNRVPTILVGSPNLLKAGSVVAEHYDGYSVLRSIESAFGLESLGRFDAHAVPLNAAFRHQHAAERLTLQAETAATRGSSADTFGQVASTAAVKQGQALTLVASGDLEEDTVVNFEPLGVIPHAGSRPIHFNRDKHTVTLQTTGLQPGFYATWLRDGLQAPHQAPTIINLLPAGRISAQNPGVEIVGVPKKTKLGIREAANLIVHYCRPAHAAPADTWIGIFQTGTPSSQMTQANAEALGGFWLKTPGDKPGLSCGEAMAFTAELVPEQDYQIFMFYKAANGLTSTVGTPATFSLTPALPQ